jgi:hypothetical protein
MDEFYDLLTADEKTVFSTIAESAYALGYKAKKEKTKKIGYNFTHSKIKKRLLGFTVGKGKPLIRLKYFATPNYSQFFDDAVKRTIEEFDFKYTGCYGCGKCDSTHGYTIHYPDGRQYYLCGSELIEIYDIKNLPLNELLDLFKNQHEYFLAGN